MYTHLSVCGFSVVMNFTRRPLVLMKGCDSKTQLDNLLMYSVRQSFTVYTLTKVLVFYPIHTLIVETTEDKYRAIEIVENATRTIILTRK